MNAKVPRLFALLLPVCLEPRLCMRGDSMTIARHGTQRASKGPDQYFTGAVTVQPLYQPRLQPLFGCLRHAAPPTMMSICS